MRRTVRDRLIERGALDSNGKPPKIVKRCDVPMNDIRNLTDAAEQFEDCAKNLKTIVNSRIPQHSKLRWAADEINSTARTIRDLNKPRVRAWHDEESDES